jgi:tetratricopeptide (TPR) repeat protein
MKQPRPAAKQKKQRRRWRWHIPPAILQGEEKLEGMELLGELQANPTVEIDRETGLVLWQSLRDVTLWASFDTMGQPGAQHAEEEEKDKGKQRSTRDYRPTVADRAGLFSPEAVERRNASLAKIDPELGITAPLQVLAGLLEDPLGTPQEAVTAACGEISQWAEEHEILATALAFAQAAALASPRDPVTGLRVGKLARKKGENARAETWFRRTVGLARQAKDWASYAEAFLWLGNLYVQRGSFPVAQHLFIRSLRAAKRHSLRGIQGGALHDLFGVAVETGRITEAAGYARRAFEAYGPEHPRIPALAHDVAYFWLTLGHFEPALSVFQALLPEIHSPANRMVVLGNLARAAGGVGDRELFTETHREVRKIAGTGEVQDHVARALLDAAHGAASLGEWEVAEETARAAYEAAVERQEGRVQITAESLLEAVGNERAAELVGTSAVRAGLAEEVDAFASELVQSLREQTAAS